MTDDFEKTLGSALKKLGTWSPPPLTAAMRERLVNLPNFRTARDPAFNLVWRLADSAATTLVEVGDMVKTILAAPQTALLRGDAATPAAQVLECSLGSAILKITITPDASAGSELRLAVALEGAGEGNFNIELMDDADDDILESRPLRQTTSMTLHNGGAYRLAVRKDDEEIGRVRFRLDKHARDGAAETPC